MLGSKTSFPWNVSWLLRGERGRWPGHPTKVIGCSLTQSFLEKSPRLLGTWQRWAMAAQAWRRETAELHSLLQALEELGLHAPRTCTHTKLRKTSSMPACPCHPEEVAESPHSQALLAIQCSLCTSSTGQHAPWIRTCILTRALVIPAENSRAP